MTTIPRAVPQPAPTTGGTSLHLFAWSFRHVHLDGLAGRVEYAQLLNDASEIRTIVDDPKVQAQNTTMPGVEGALTLQLPVQHPDVLVPVIKLFLREQARGGSGEGGGKA